MILRLFTFAALLSGAASSAQAQPAILRSWILNITGQTGYNGLVTNVQRVQYSEQNVYVSCSCIPGYDIGPWGNNPNKPANQNFVFRITRIPAVNMGTKTATPMGHIGVWSNGVSVFNALDARSYNNQNTWHQDAVWVEGSGFDDCLGHPAPNGEYHHHLNPICLYNPKDSSKHSPVIGYAFDGFPIYGAYGYDTHGAVTRMRSSYRIRTMTDRTTLPDGTKLATNMAGPAIGAQYPLGYYVEDYEYVVGLGDLDKHNGRFAITPEYPEGTYAYFVTIDEKGVAAYPYTLGPTYYGVVPAGNTGPQSGHVTVSEQVTTYVPNSASVEEFVSLKVSAYPNPTHASVTLDLRELQVTPERYMVSDVAGRIVLSGAITAAEQNISLEVLPGGSYTLLAISESGERHVIRIIKE